MEVQSTGRPVEPEALEAVLASTTTVTSRPFGWVPHGMIGTDGKDGPQTVEASPHQINRTRTLPILTLSPRVDRLTPNSYSRGMSGCTTIYVSYVLVPHARPQRESNSS